jgi:hypothetical protein
VIDSKEPVCYACKDPGLRRIKLDDGSSAWVCYECWQELRFGVIPRDPVHFLGGGIYGPRDDTSPGTDNCIRQLEDGYNQEIPYNKIGEIDT